MRDVIVIGAGPAGSVAALLLSRSGLDVALIEQHRFPRDKVCGECLSSTGIEVLRRIGLSTQIQSLDPALLRHTILHAPDGSEARLDLPQNMLGISRAALDGALIDAAAGAGTTILQPARVEAISPGLMPTVQVRDLVSNRVETIGARFVIVADGKAALLPERPDSTSDLGIKTHFHGVNGPRDAVELFGVRGHYGGLAAIEGDRWNAAFSVPAERIAKCSGNFDLLLDQMMSENPAFARRLCRARRDGPWLASALPRHGVSHRWPAGIIPVGNAAAALEPIGGEGMGLAMRSAEMAAVAIADSIRNNTKLGVAALRTAFNRLWRVRRTSCRALAMMISRPSLAEIVVPAAHRGGGLTRLAMWSMGK